jgi:hypothetical protein
MANVWWSSIGTHAWPLSSGVLRLRRHQRPEWHQELVDADVVLVAAVFAASRDTDPRLMLLHLEGGREVATLPPLRNGAALAAMQDRRMCRVDLAFQGLQPVALLDTQRDQRVGFRDHVPFQIGQRREIPGGFAHISPQHTVALTHRISLDAHALGHGDCLRAPQASRCNRLPPRTSSRDRRSGCRPPRCARTPSVRHGGGKRDLRAPPVPSLSR